MIKMKRAYEPAQKDDGYRVLIDRLWPRGIKKEKLVHDEWAKELAPSTELRQSFGHEESKWKEFRAQYKRELRHKEASEKISSLARRARRKTVTLVYSARDEEHNDAVVLKEVLERMVKKLGEEN
ncbi:MAG: DUF488 domain-containing protein [Bacteriovorax sp.]